MATTDKPSASIHNQPLTNVPITADDTIMDDTVVIMDDPTALMGGLTTTMENVKSKVSVNKPKADMPRAR